MPELSPVQLESMLAEHWCELLDVDTASPTDSFVKLGGNSLLATMLANRIEEDLEFRPCLTDILMSNFAELLVICEKGEEADGL